MSFIEMPVAEYRRRLAALPRARAADDAGAATARPVPAVTDDDVRALRARHPGAFAALDADHALPAPEVAERERLIVTALLAVRPPA